MNRITVFKIIGFRWWYFLILYNCTNSTLPDKNIKGTKIDPENYDHLKIGNIIKYNGVDNLIIGDSIAKLWTLFPMQDIEFYEDFGYFIDQGDSMKLLVSSKDQIHIATLEFYSSNFKMGSGVFPGMSIEEVQKLYPNFSLVVNQIDLTEEMFCPDELNLRQNGVAYLTCINFLNEGNDDFIGDYPSIEPESTATKVRKSVVVNNIRVFLPGDGLDFKK